MPFDFTPLDDFESSGASVDDAESDSPRVTLPLKFQEPEDLSGYSPEQLSALNYNRQRELGVIPPSEISTATPMDPLLHLPRYERLPSAPGIPEDIMAGLYNTGAGLVEGFTSPVALASMGVGGALPALARPIAGLWTAQMASQLPEQAVDVYGAYKLDEPRREKIEKTLGLLGGLAFTGLAGKHALSRPVILPESMRQLQQEPPITGEPNAIQERQAAEVYGGLPEQPQRNEQLPAERGGEQVPSGNLPPGDQGGAQPAEETRGREVPLSEVPPDQRAKMEDIAQDVARRRKYRPAGITENGEVITGNSHADIGENASIKSYGYSTNGKNFLSLLEVARQEMEKNPEAYRKFEEERFTTGAGGEKPEIANLGKSDINNNHGDPLGTSYRATPEDWAQWKQVQADLRQQLMEGKDATDPEVSRIWAENERIKNKYGGMPPQEPGAGLTEASPFNHKEFITTDAEGNTVLDVEKFQKGLAEGKVKGGEVANQLLSHLLKPDEKHPLKAIKVMDLSPGELQMVTGKPTAYRGRFTTERGAREGTVEVLTREEGGQPINHAEFVKTLNHELTHNAVTSKYESASPEVKASLDKLFAHAKEQAKGTEFETHGAMADVHEFLAEATSSPKIQTWLTKMAYEGAGKAKNVWGRFVELVHKLLRAPKDLPLTALDEAMRISGELEGVRREAKGPVENFANAKKPVRAKTPEEAAEMADRLGFATRPAAPAPEAAPAPPTSPTNAPSSPTNPSGAPPMRPPRPPRPPGGPPGPPPGGPTPPGAPPPPPPATPVGQAQSFLSGLPNAYKVATAQLAGHSAPRTSVASPESGNALVRYASAKIAAPLVAESMSTDVLGPHYKDIDFAKKLGAVLVEDRLRGIKDAFERGGESEKAAQVNSIIGQQDSPLQSEADFRAALADPEIQAAIARHKESIQPVAESAHEEAGGTLAGPGLNTGAFVNLKAIFEGSEENLLGGGGRGNLMNPLRRPSKFSKTASGTASKYEVDYRTIAERMIEGNFEENTKRGLYKQLVQDGLAKILDPGEPPPDIGGKPAVKFTIERKGVPAGGGKARTYVKNLWIREDLAGEYRQAINTDGPIQRAAVLATVNLANQIQLAGPTDAVWHVASALGSIAGSPGGKNALIDLARALPGVNIADAVGRTVAGAIRVLRDSPDVQRDVAELARIGTMRPKEKPSRLTVVNAMHKLVRLVDTSARLVRNDMYNNLVARGLKPSEAGRREWVNQMGQYNPRLMGEIQRWFKERGFSPFIVAGRNFNRMAMRRITLDPGVAGASPAMAAQMRAVNFLGTAATLFAIPAMFNYLLTGTPGGRPGTKLGQIDTGKDDADGKHIVIDPAQWTGLRRGLRISGIQAVIEGARRGETKGKITQSVIKDILGGVIHPWAGPAVTAASIATTGYSPTMYKESENPKDYGANVKAAGEQLNPVLKGVFKAWEENSKKTSLSGNPAQFLWGAAVGSVKETAKSLAGAAGIKENPPFTAFNAIGNVHQGWLSTNEDPKVKADYERNLAATYPVTKYKSLDDALTKGDEAGALKAIGDLRAEGQTDKLILQRMRPYVGQGVHSRTKPLFHENKKLESEFRDSLNPAQEEQYQKALEERKDRYQQFLEVWAKRDDIPEPTTRPPAAKPRFNFTPIGTNAPARPRFQFTPVH